MMVTNPETLLQNLKRHWRYHSQGNFNAVYISKEPLEIEGAAFRGHWVLKVPLILLQDQAYANAQEMPTPVAIDQPQQTGETPSNSRFNVRQLDPSVLHTNRLLSKAARAVRKWNLLNPNYPAILIRNQCWMAPYLGDWYATDEQVADKLLEIYLRTGNLVVDLMGNGNCVVYEREVCCIDVDLSLDPQSTPSELYLSGIRHTPETRQDFKHYLFKFAKIKPISALLVRNLHYLIEQGLHGSLQAHHLTPGVLHLVHVYASLKRGVTLETMDMLSELDRANESLTDKCFALLDITTDTQMRLELCMHCFLGEILSAAQVGRLLPHLSRLKSLNTPGASGFNLLHSAIIRWQNLVIPILITLGADVNLPVCMDGLELDSYLPVELALHYRNSIAVHQLLASNLVLPEAIEGSHHHIHVAAVQGLTGLLSHILDTVQVRNCTPESYFQSREVFFQSGVQGPWECRANNIVNLRDEHGKTPLDYAVKNDQRDAALFLREQGGLLSEELVSTRQQDQQHEERGRTNGFH